MHRQFPDVTVLVGDRSCLIFIFVLAGHNARAAGGSLRRVRRGRLAGRVAVASDSGVQSGFQWPCGSHRRLQPGFLIDAKHRDLLQSFMATYFACYDEESRRAELLLAYEENAQYTFCCERLDPKNSHRFIDQ